MRRAAVGLRLAFVTTQRGEEMLGWGLFWFYSHRYQHHP
jgi:hypothetical protein